MSYARLLCDACGPRLIDEAEYSRQLDLPDDAWSCPSCKGPADFDDSYYEEQHVRNTDECDINPDEPDDGIPF